jgi:hypothetical protein
MSLDLLMVVLIDGDPPLNGIGCYVTGGDTILLVAWTLLMLYDASELCLAFFQHLLEANLSYAAMMVLMLIPGIKDCEFSLHMLIKVSSK